MQKLKKQLVDKEKALADEIEASLGFQAKLKELRFVTYFYTHEMEVNVSLFSSDQFFFKSCRLSLSHTRTACPVLDA